MNLYIEDTNEIEMRANQEDEIRLQAGDTINIGGGGGSASAFIAEYGATPYADVKDAYDKDAIIICTVDDSGNTVICQLAYFDDANDTFCFAQPVSEGAYWVSISSDDTWNDGYFLFASTETATQLRNGLMTALDKQKLDGIESGAEVNVQSDWNATSGDAQILNKPSIPTKTSDLRNDSGFITEDDIPPLVTDLGYIDPEPYEEDVFIYMNTLTESGFYKFVFGGDDLTFFVAVQAFYMEGSDITLVNQHYWGDEEGPITEYIRAITLEGDEVVDEQTTAYITMEGAVNAFASKSHVHYRVATSALSVWDYCNGSQISFITDSPILYTDTREPRHAWLIETTATTSAPNRRFIRLTDLQDASVIYQRSGVYSNGVITWGEWEYIGSLKITVNGTSYPITAITSTTVSGVSGVLVDYDDGNSGQLFFADGAGLATVKSAIESGIPHDTSELTNGAGFLTISDLPIYNGGVQ